MIRLLVGPLVFLCSLGIRAQCISVGELVTVLNDRPGVDIVDSLAAICPMGLDSVGSALHNLSIYYWGLGNVDRAITEAERALRVRKRLYANDPKLPLGKTLNNLGMFYKGKQNYVAARRFFKASADVFSQVDHQDATRRYGLSLLNLSFAQQQLGDFELAQETLEVIIGDNNPIRVEAGLRLGELLYESGEYAASVERLKTTMDQFDFDSQPLRYLTCVVSLASALYEIGDYGSARSELDAVEPYLDDIKSNEAGRATGVMALTALKTGRLKVAEDYYQKSLAYSKASGDPYFIASAHQNGAEVAFERRDFKLAKTRTLRAIAAIVPNFSVGKSAGLPSSDLVGLSPFKVYLLFYLQDYARIEAADGNAVAAARALYLADHVVSHMTADAVGTSSRFFWRGRVTPVYEAGIQLAYEQGNPKDAWYFFQRSRAALLARGMAEARLTEQLPAAIAGELDSLRFQYFNYQREVLAAGEGSGRDSLLQLEKAARNAFRARQRDIVRDYPGLLLTVETEVISLDSVRALLRSNGVDEAWQFFYGQDRAYLLVIGAEELALHDLGPVAELTPLITAVMDYYARPDSIQRDAGGYLAASTALFNHTVAPATAPKNRESRNVSAAERSVVETEAVERVLVLPDGPFSYLPFAALVRRPADDLLSADYLMRHYQISYAESFRVLATQLEARTGQGVATVFAPFAPPLAAGLTAPALPASVGEADLLRRNWRAEPVLRAAADRATFLAAAPRSRLLHLSTHAYADREGNQAPRILTADGPVFLPDIYGLDLRGCDLVTLSACQTNVGQSARGEGVLSLNRAFTHAGARGVVATSWSVNDEATAALMKNFYAALAEGQSKPAALRTAQLAYLTDPSRPGYARGPYAWAGLSYYGAVTPMAGSGGNNWVWWLLGSFVVAGLAYVLYRHLQRP